MDKKSIIIIILFLAIVGLSVSAYQLYVSTSENVTLGEHNVLVLCADSSEGRPGMGAVDMALIIKLNDGNITKITQVYPGGMMHPTAPVPDYLKSIGETKLRLHDSLWDNDTEKGVKLAQEIVEINTGQKTDVVLVVKVEAVDAALRSIGPIYVEGLGDVSGNSLQLIRDEQAGGVSRGNAVQKMMTAILNTTQNDKSKYLTLINVGVNQYSQGNIYVYPKGAFAQFLISEGIQKTL
ncbi:MAG: DUF4012 domain-containing protein [Methanobacteriaceae archaeon]|jgi:hypothetical protein|nr:DUF4012 domain-containing protein [Methanobacteriaceae archaeon]MDO9626279.1 DUF4012 domain-containing protein [Methanobacteriaceae archaeon]